ncbi:hypothetical protein [Burkholderia ubonensis]|uniref:hypothetical protein n=1 Tax=Burkholderia ubonensis TaxID=101571 RepID=UPI000A4857C8|nr:hypothetical protein [Burkholderia ubonensis]
MNKCLVFRRVLRSLSLLAGLWLAACGISPSSQAPALPQAGSEVRGNVTIHTWRPIASSPTQAWTGPRTKLFTYVLVGDIGNGNVNEATWRARQGLDQLIQEVQAGQQLGEGQGNLTLQMLEQANQFCIPATDRSLKKVTLAEYSFSLAAEYLNTFRVVLRENEQLSKSLSGVGPFLIATRKPVGELVSQGAQGTIDTNSPVLVMDMSGRHPDAIAEYVNAFKVAVRKDVADTAQLKPLRPTIASYLLIVNEAIPLVAEAYAGTTKYFR